MNIYDFDKTIYAGDSTADFLFFCASRHAEVRRMLPKIAWNGMKYLTGAIEKQTFKEGMFRFLSVMDAKKELSVFWDGHLDRIKAWYLAQQREDDLIISASPLFIVEEACRRIGIKYILASPVDPETGKYSGPNCHGEEKVVRLHSAFPDAVCERFYSDSYCDTPLARLAKEAFLVKGEKILPWRKL